MTQNTIKTDSRRRFGISADMLKIFACVFMLMDHMWATVIPGNNWLTYVGRMTFPIFAFMVSEGFVHTSNYKKYVTRLLVFALISEVPFDLMYASTVFFPFHQNVMFTLLLGLLAIGAYDKARKNPTAKQVIISSLLLVVCVLLGGVLFVDYSMMGVITVLGFYVVREFPFTKIWQAALLILLNIVFFSGQTIPVTLGSFSFDFTTQGFAVFSLIFIWLYNGQKGTHSKALQYGFYAFYPVHALILYLIVRFMI